MGKITSYKLCTVCKNIYDENKDLEILNDSVISKKIPALRESYVAGSTASKYLGVCFDCFVKPINISLAACAFKTHMDLNPLKELSANVDNMLDFKESGIEETVSNTTLECLEMYKLRALKDVLMAIEESKTNDD